MRLTVGKWKGAALPVTAEEALRLGAGTLVHQEIGSLDQLRQVMAAHAQTVRASFLRYVGPLG